MKVVFSAFFAASAVKFGCCDYVILRHLMRSGNRFVIALIAAPFVGLVALWFVADRVFDVRTVPPRLPTGESTERDMATREVFRKNTRAPNGEEFEPLFAKLGELERAKKGRDWAECFDADRMATELANADIGEPLDGTDRTALTPKVRIALKKLGENGGLALTGTMRVLKVALISGGADAIVCTRLDSPTASVPYRWWLARIEGGWLIYDVEDLRMGLRMTDQLAQLVAHPSDAEGTKSQAKAILAVRAATVAANEGNFVAVESELKAARTVPLPRGHRVVVALLEASVALSRGQPNDALRHADDAAKIRPSTPAIHLVRASAHLQLKAYTDAIRSAQDYERDIGPDPQSAFAIAISYLSLKQPDPAKNILASALRTFPNDRRLLELQKQVNE